MKQLKIFIALLLTISLFGCTKKIEDEEPENKKMTYQESEITDIANVDFDVFQKLYSDKENLVYSPLSLKIALVMAANGADNDTLKEFEKVFGCSLKELNKQIETITKSLEDVKGDTVLSLANSIWVSNEFEVFDDYLNTLVKKFEAEVFNKDLTTKQTLEELNQWVNDKTNGLIKKIKDEEFEKDQLAVLINALYLKASWMIMFEDAFDYPFHTKDGDVTVDMMSLETRLDYLSNEKHEGVILPYNDDKTIMVCVKGQDLDKFNLADLNALLETKQEYKTKVLLPKFEAENTHNLVEIMKSCGLKLAFDKENADFSKLGKVLPDENIYINEVIQKTKIIVDVKGTEAAAVTMVGFAKCTSLPKPEEIKYVAFDEPFIYFIMDQATNTILFMGVTNNPNL